MPEIKQLLKSRESGFESSLKVMNFLFDGKPYRPNAVFSIFARPNTGKTLLVLQEAIYHASKGRGVLLIDTEGSMSYHIEKWAEKFFKRFGEPQAPLIVEELDTVESLLQFFGFKAEVHVSDKGKADLRIKGSIASKAEQLIRKHGIKIVFIDSLTNPIKTLAGGTQNLPARSMAFNMLFYAISKLRENYKTSFVLTNHASMNPQARGYQQITVYGGDTIIYNSKQIMYMDMRGGADYRRYRRMWVYRKPDTAPFEMAGVVMVTEEGFKDLPPESWKVHFTQTELTEVLKVKPWEKR